MSRARKWLAILLAVALVLPQVPAARANAGQETRTVQESGVVYVDGTKESSGDGSSAEKAFRTLPEAYEYLEANSADQGGTVVICGNTPVSSALDLSGKQIPGGVTLTSKNGEEDYTASAALSLGAELDLSDKTVIENLKIELSASEAEKTISVYSGLDLQIGDGVEITEPDVAGRLKLFCGKKAGTGEGTIINVTVASGTYHTIFMGGNSGSAVNGDINLTIGGSTRVTSNVMISPNQGTSGDLNFTMNGGYVLCIYNNTGAKTGKVGKAGNAVVNLNAGEIGRMTYHKNKNGSLESFTVNLHGGFKYGLDSAGQFGNWPAGITVGATTLNLIGFTEADQLAEDFWNGYGTVNITGNSDVTYGYTLGATPAVTVEGGSTLKLPANEDGTGVNVTGDGQVVYGASEEQETYSVVYVDGTKTDSGDGKTAGTAFGTLEEAYTYLKANSPTLGGTVVICGNTSIGEAAALETYGIDGPVTLTSKSETEEFSGAALTLGNNVTLGVNTVLKDLRVILKAEKPGTYMYSGVSLVVGENVSFEGMGTLYCGNYSSDCGDVNVTVGSGTLKQILIGSTHDVGNCIVTVEGTADITSNVSLGAGKKAGNITFNMNGGKVKMIYDTPRDYGTVGDVTVNLNGGAIISMADYTKIKNNASMNSVTVNLGPDFTAVSPLGEWTASKLTVGGEKTINLLGTTGTLIDGAITNYTRVNVKNSANVVYDSELSAGTVVTVEDGSVLTLNGYTDQADAKAKGITFEGSGKVLFAGQTIEYLSVVYVDGTKSDSESGDGKTAATAVNTLTEAYKLLDAAKGGTLVICGDVVISKNLDLEPLNVTGTVTMTSVTDTEDFREKASLVISGKSTQLALTDSTVMDKLNIRAETSNGGSQLMYSGLNLDIKDTVTSSGNGTFKIFCGRMSDTTGQTINVRVYGGKYNQIFMGGHTKVNSGNVNLEVGGEISVTSNIAFGGNTTDCGDLNFTMNGGYVKVLYDTPSSNGKVGRVTANLNGGTITEMRDYNSKTGMEMGDITINVSSAFNCGSAQFGVWSSGAVTTGKRTLNVTDYQGGNMNSLGNYHVVNVFGGRVPDGFVSPTEEDSLNIYDYSGILGLSLDSFSAVTATGAGCDVTFLGAVPTGSGGNPMKLTANDGATLRIRSSQNPGATRADFAITENNGGKVVLEEPAYEGKEVVLSVDFNDKTAADSSANGNNGVITGNPAFVESYDGSSAVYFNNAFGAGNASRAAGQYITFADPAGIDLTRDDFTVMFWYQTVNGGHTEWAKGGQAATAGSGLHMNNAKVGGVVFSNQDTVSDTDGFSAAQLAQNEFFTTGLTDKDGVHHDADGIRRAADDRWHMVTVVYDRSSNYKVYVDEVLAAVVDISSLADQALGVNTLVFGADLKGQYGLENAYLDDLAIYKGAMSQVDVQANFYLGRLAGLIHSVEKRVEELGSEYDPYKAALLAKNNEVKDAAKALTLDSYGTAVVLYQELWDAYEEFLTAPARDAKLSALLLSDIHIGASGDSDSVKLGNVFRDLSENGLQVDVMINAGDFGDNSKAEATQAAYEEFLRLRGEHGLTDMMMVAAYGNHEIQYTNESANYKVSTPIYWEYIMNHIREFVDKGEAKVDYINHDADCNSNSYSVTFKGYHFLVLNGDYLEQTGDSSTYKDANGKYSIEGNAVDPIRHGAHFYDSTLEWAKMVLDEYSQDELPIFVINHFPFIDTVPLSYYSEIVINDNSIGKQDPEVRRLLGSYDNVFYFCGHLHSSFGMNEPVEVVSDDGGSFIELNLAAIKGASRSYANVPASWLMYVYEDEIVLRARDFTTGQWLPQYDEVLPLTKKEQPPKEQSPIVIEEVGEVTEDTEDFLLKVSGGADELEYQFSGSDDSVLTVDENGKVHVVGAGTATITVTKSGEGYVTVSAQVTITVKPGAAQNPVVQSPIEIRDVGEVTEVTEDFVLSVSGGANELNYQFSSSDENVLTVDENGKVHVVGAGTATITVTKSGEGYVTVSAQIIITVKAAPEQPETSGQPETSEEPGNPETPETSDPGNGEGPATGDNNTPAVWILAMAVCAVVICAAAVYVVIKRRKSENNR